jgi:hypothetical protein
MKKGSQAKIGIIRDEKESVSSEGSVVSYMKDKVNLRYPLRRAVMKKPKKSLFFNPTKN